ncbi:MAG: hypothetical protein P8X82_17715, partial [Gemmatimonadales bacterium]
DRYFKDVVSMTVAVTDTRRVHLVNRLTELGYAIDRSGDVTVCTGKENVIRLIPKTDQKYSITRMTLSLMRANEGKKSTALFPTSF